MVTVAVDFDGTITQYKGWKGESHYDLPQHDARRVLSEVKQLGCTVVIWTARSDLSGVAHYLRRYGIPFDSINATYGDVGESRKIKADRYWDDKTPGWGGLTNALVELRSYLSGSGRPIVSGRGNNLFPRRSVNVNAFNRMACSSGMMAGNRRRKNRRMRRAAISRQMGTNLNGFAIEMAAKWKPYQNPATRESGLKKTILSLLQDNAMYAGANSMSTDINGFTAMAADWKPYTDPESGRTGWISSGGRIRYQSQKPGGKDKGTKKKIKPAKYAAKASKGKPAPKLTPATDAPKSSSVPAAKKDLASLNSAYVSGYLAWQDKLNNREPTGTQYEKWRKADKALISALPVDGWEPSKDSPDSPLLFKKSFDRAATYQETRKSLSKAGYEFVGRSKMMGGNDTIESFVNPKMPEHRVIVHATSRRTRMGQIETSFTMKIEPRFSEMEKSGSKSMSCGPAKVGKGKKRRVKRKRVATMATDVNGFKQNSSIRSAVSARDYYGGMSLVGGKKKR